MLAGVPTMALIVIFLVKPPVLAENRDRMRGRLGVYPMVMQYPKNLAHLWLLSISRIMAAPAMAHSMSNTIHNVRVLGKYVLPVTATMMKMNWNPYAIIWISSVVNVLKPNPEMTIEPNYFPISLQSPRSNLPRPTRPRSLHLHSVRRRWLSDRPVGSTPTAKH